MDVTIVQMIVIHPKMKKLLLILSIVFCISTFSSCDIEEDASDSIAETTSETEWECGTHNGKTLWTGPRGGCYYKNSNGNKTYVDRSECNC